MKEVNPGVPLKEAVLCINCELVFSYRHAVSNQHERGKCPYCGSNASMPLSKGKEKK